MVRRTLLICLALLCLPGSAGAADLPTATTGAAAAVGQSTATLTATVDPNGTDTVVHFEIGTTTAYGLQSSSTDVGAGTDGVAVSTPVASLTAGTSYHVRVVAVSAAGTVRGADLRFTTAPTPVPPAVVSATTQGTTQSGTTLMGTVNPHGVETTYHFEYGLTKGYGAAAGQGDAGSGSTNVPVSARVEGLTSGATYHFRIVAASAAGTTRSSDHTVTIKAGPTSITLAGPAGPVTYGQAAPLTGRLAGHAIGHVLVHVQGTPYPFLAPFGDVATTTTTSSGTFAVSIPALLQTLRLRAYPGGSPAIVSPTVTVSSAARVGILHRRLRRSSVRVVGRLAPGGGSGSVSAQRQTARGWSPLAHRSVAADGVFGIDVRRAHKALTLRIVGLPNDGGAHLRGTSRTFTVPALLRRR